MFGVEVYSRRLAEARRRLRAAALDFLVVGPSADLRYLTGALSRPTERMAVLILPQEGPATMLVPGFEAASLPPMPSGVSVLTWREADNPGRLAAGVISGASGFQPGGFHCTIAVSDRLWAAFLLRIQSELPRANFTSAGATLSSMRQSKSGEEIGLLARSGHAADEVFARIIQEPFQGKTEMQIAGRISLMLEENGLEVPGIPIVAAGPNSSSPHHHSGERVLQAGDVVVLDFGGTVDGYYSDISRTVFVGGMPNSTAPEMAVYHAVQQAQETAVEGAREGLTCEALDTLARSVLVQAGLGAYFTHRLGHGIGLDGHEPPYLVEGNRTRLENGFAFTIEPGAYLPGRFGVRIEDTVCLVDGSARRLNNANRDPIVVA